MTEIKLKFLGFPILAAIQGSVTNGIVKID